MSGKSITYNGKENPEYYRCNFSVLDNQTVYNFTVHGSNPIGQSESSLLIDIKYRGKIYTYVYIYLAPKISPFGAHTR